MCFQASVQARWTGPAASCGVVLGRAGSRWVVLGDDTNREAAMTRYQAIGHRLHRLQRPAWAPSSEAAHGLGCGPQPVGGAGCEVRRRFRGRLRDLEAPRLGVTVHDVT